MWLFKKKQFNTDEDIARESRAFGKATIAVDIGFREDIILVTIAIEVEVCSRFVEDRAVANPCDPIIDYAVAVIVLNGIAGGRNVKNE